MMCMQLVYKEVMHMKVEIPDSFVKKVNKILSNGWDWEGTEEEWRDYIIELIKKDLDLS